ncbi:MAG: DUF4416 family protein [Elusimicrobiota bacterium]|nr:DUF4416 family protein [Elusimicrobiota bacterium]
MGKIGSAEKVKLFCGILSTDENIDKKALSELEKKLGGIDAKSEVMNFKFSDYYNLEMGSNIKRYWISFKNLIFADEIADIKIFTNDIEDSFAKDGKRLINIDPGYLTQANVILATTKNFSHRIYLQKGIYAEVTTIYNKKDGFIKLPWSYPDYMSAPAKDFLLKVRKNLLGQLKLSSRKRYKNEN